MTPDREREIRAACERLSPDLVTMRRDLLAEVDRLRAQLREAAEEVEHYSRERTALRAEALREAAGTVEREGSSESPRVWLDGAVTVAVAGWLRAMADEAERGSQ